MITKLSTKKAAIGRWAEIYKRFGLPGVTGKKHWPKEYPVCGRKGKFRCDDKDGTGSYICVCGSGDGWALLAAKTGKEFKVLAAEVDQIIGNEYTHDRTIVNPARTTLAQQREKVSRKFAKLTTLRGTGADSYLKGRGINSLPAESVRYCDKQPVDGKNLQAIYALATDDRGELCYLHRTLLDGDRRRSQEDDETAGGQLFRVRQIRSYPHVPHILNAWNCRRDRNGSGLSSDHEVQHLGDDEYRLHEEIPCSCRGKEPHHFC